MTNSLSLADRLTQGHIEIKQYSPEEIIEDDSPTEHSGHFVTNLLFHDFPKNKEIILSVRRLVAKNPEAFEEQERFTISDENYIVINNQRAEKYRFLSKTFLPGERIHCRFTTIDGKFCYETSFIPHPIKVSNKSKSITLDGELIVLAPTTYIFNLKGVKEGDTLTLYLSSYDKSEKLNIKFSGQGIMVMPGVENKKGGLCKVGLETASKDHIFFKLPWGINLIEYLADDLVYTPQGPQKVKIPGILRY